MDYWHPFEENCFYHIYNRSNNKEAVFLSEDNYSFFLKKWGEYLGSYMDTFSYVLIPNHFHFTVRIRKVDAALLENAKAEKTVACEKFIKGEITLDEFLEDQMKRFLISYAKAFNKREQREGSVFQKRFKRIGIRNENHLCYLIAYHHHNPIHHKLVKNYQDWKFSSYLTMLSEAPTRICRGEVLHLFFNDDLQKGRSEFIRYHQEFKLDKGLDFLIWDE
ncbi:MAG: hypothetical protein IPM82_10050 [Saprospiraceae bacterium]|nr:hypothetical protein [Saprospiraceae bacterium]